MKNRLSTGIFWFLIFMITGCSKKTEKSGEIIDYIPESASTIFRISDWKTFSNDLIQNAFIASSFTDSETGFFKKHESFFSSLNPEGENLLCIEKRNDSLYNFTFISSLKEDVFQMDSLSNRKLETLSIGNKSIKRIEMDNQLFFSAETDDVFLASSSQEVLMAVLEGKTKKDMGFQKAYQLPASKGNALYVKSKGKSLFGEDFTHWSALDIHIKPEVFYANGISLASDSIPQLLSVFKEQPPQENSLADLVPINAKGALSFTFDDSEKFRRNLSEFRGDTKNVISTGIFDSSKEVGFIEMKQGTVVFLKSIDASFTQDALARFVSSKENFRDIEIKTFQESSLFEEVFSPLIQTDQANLMFQLEDFFVFAPDENTAQEVIGAFLNNSTLKNTSYFEESTSNLSSASSILVYSMDEDFTDHLQSFLNLNIPKTKLSDSKFPLIALQFSYDRNFAHIALNCREFGGKSRPVATGITEKFHINLEHPLLTAPKVFESNGYYVVAQDVENTLIFVSENGKILWKKSLDSPVLGDIHAVDLYRNGNQQMAFVTKNHFYILDRNGKDVGRFPLKFKDEVTQPLSVFDYDNNGNYRFVVTQNRGILMYDKDAKIVSGFGFKTAPTKVVLPPAHIRMGNKDYILIAEQSGKLNILHRTGQSRVNVSHSFDFSSIPLSNEDSHFIVFTKDRTKIRIDEKGGVSSQKLDVGENFHYSFLGNTRVLSDDHSLKINGKSIALPIGNYSPAVVQRISRTPYIALTETSEKKVYVLNESGSILKGFPVFGSSEPSIGGSGLMAVKGDNNGIIVYQLN